MNVSEYIFDFFNQKGVDTCFMVTGGQAMYLDDAVAKNSHYHIICNHHEQASTMCADAYGRFKLKPAIALVTTGPGSVNAINGVVGAYTDSSPLIVVSGQTNFSFVKYQEKSSIRQFGVQGINIKPMVEDTVKSFITIDDVSKLRYYLTEAWQSATMGRPGPVWIDVPLDIQRREVSEDNIIEESEEDAVVDYYLLGKAVDSTINKLRVANRPLLLVGQGVSLSGAKELLVKLVEVLHVPVLTSRLGIDVINSDNIYYVGRPGNYGERAANFAVQNADLIISIGSRLAAATVGRFPREFGKNAYKIVIDIDQKELDKPGVFINEKVKLDCKTFISALLNKLTRVKLPDYSCWVRRTQEWKNKYPVVLPEYKNQEPVNSYYFVDRLSRFAPSNASVLVDTGSCFHVAAQTWRVKAGQRYITTGGLSSMGYWCAGIGSCVANEFKETIVITGDGSLQMNIQELATVRHNNIPLKIFVINNNGYLLIRSAQKNYMEGYLVGESPATGVWCPDLNKISSAYDIPFIRINKVNEVDSFIKKAFDIEGPVICEVITPEWQTIAPRTSAEKLPNGKILAHDYSDMYPFLPKEEYEAQFNNE